MDDNERSRPPYSVAQASSNLYYSLNVFRRGPAGVMLVRRERGRTAMQAKERRARRTAAEKALREEEDRLAAVEAQKVPI